MKVEESVRSRDGVIVEEDRRGSVTQARITKRNALIGSVLLAVSTLIAAVVIGALAAGDSTGQPDGVVQVELSDDGTPLPDGEPVVVDPVPAPTVEVPVPADPAEPLNEHGQPHRPLVMPEADPIDGPQSPKAGPDPDEPTYVPPQNQGPVAEQPDVEPPAPAAPSGPVAPPAPPAGDTVDGGACEDGSCHSPSPAP